MKYKLVPCLTVNSLRLSRNCMIFRSCHRTQVIGLCKPLHGTVHLVANAEMLASQT